MTLITPASAQLLDCIAGLRARHGNAFVEPNPTLLAAAHQRLTQVDGAVDDAAGLARSSSRVPIRSPCPDYICGDAFDTSY